MAKIYQLKRMAIILNRLGGGRSIAPSELVDYVSRRMSVFDDSKSEVSLRTIQRDIRTIEELFHIVISCGPDRKYRITDRSGSAEEYESLLLNYELLSSIDSDLTLQKYVLAEHRRPVFDIDISDFLTAIRSSHPVEFTYTLVRHEGKKVRKRILPHFLKESQQRWYVAGYDSDGCLKTFGLDRISDVRVLYDEKFKRRDDLDIRGLFDYSFGIWNNPNDPVEEIILKYDALDGSFVKTLPLHSSQEIISDTERLMGFCIRKARSKSTLIMLPMLKISMMTMVGRMVARSMCQMRCQILAPSILADS